MNESVFLSVGATSNQKQEDFVKAIEKRLRDEQFTSVTVGRNRFGVGPPLKTIIECMDESSGAIIIALERTFFNNGLEKRGGPNEKVINDLKYATPWNQIEAALAYSNGLPMMVIVENGVQPEGLLEKGYDWYVMSGDLDTNPVLSAEFNGVFSAWKKKVDDYNKELSKPAKVLSGDSTLKDVMQTMKLSHLWATILAIAALIAGAFALGTHFPHK